MDIVKHQGKILIIENNAAFRAAISAYLSGNYSVREAPSVAEAMSVVDAFQPEVVLLDKKLADNEGSGFLARLKASSPAASAIILLSGQVNIDDAVAAIKGGAADFIPKPVEPERLAQIIEQNLEQVRIKRHFHDMPTNLESRKEDAPWCLTGNLENTPISDLFQFLSFSRMTGTLEISCQLISTSIFFANGEIISAGSSDPREYLGHFMVSRGIIDENQLVELIARQAEEKTLLGKLVIHEGIAEERVVTEILIEKITETVTNLFIQPGGIFTFYQNFILPYMFHTVRVPVMGLIMKGAVKKEMWEKMRSIAPSMSAVVERLRPFEEMQLVQDDNPINARILSLLDGKHSIAEICLETHSSEWTVFSFLYPLHLNGMIRFRASEKYISGTGWHAMLAEHALEKARRLLVSGEYAKVVRLLHKVCEQSDCDWNLTLPLLQDAEQQYANWFYAVRMARTDIPYLQATANLRSLALRGAEAFLVNRINGIRDVRSLVSVSPLREVEVLLCLQHFQDNGLIAIRKPEAAAAAAEAVEKPAAQLRLFSSPVEFEPLLASLPVGVLLISPDGTIQFANDFFMKMSNLKKDQVEQQKIEAILRGQQVDQIRDSYEREFLWAGVDNNSPIRRYWLYSVHRFTEKDNEDHGLAVLLRDVTEIHRKELNDQRKDRLTSLGEFVAGMTHQLKNPVMLIEAGVKWLAEENLNKEEMADVVFRMQKNVERMRDLIANTLNYVSMDESAFTWFELNPLIDSSIASLSEQFRDSNIRVELRLMPDLPPMRANETQAREVIINLANNALHAMGNEGLLQISTDLQEELEGAVLRKYLLMVVSDTGPGMPPDIVEKLFTPFFTTKPSGKGLGLAFAKRIVEEQGGFMRCWSKEGIGTHFYVYFRIGDRDGFDLAR